MSALAIPASESALVAHAHAILDRHGRSFALAGRLLPAKARDDAAVVYAFCRLVDDTADEAPSEAVARRELDVLQAELLGEAPRRPLVRAYLDVCARTGIPAEAGAELLRGVRGDLDPVQLADDRALLRYAYRVAGTVGLMMCGVLGVRDPAARAQAIDLGVAMQLTNICRDVREDGGRGRVYLPAERLRAAGVEPDQLLACVDRAPEEAIRAATATVVHDLLALAERYYASARTGVPAIPLRARLAIGAAARIYRAIGTRLARRHRCDAWHGRTVVPWGARIVALLDGMRWALFARRAPHDAPLHDALRGLPGV
ncbi:MAG: hypothetical protein RIT45_3454 [Pseudomonadota bacterium]|jgi:phytoene synthase